MNCEEILIWLKCSPTTDNENSVHGRIIFNFPDVIAPCTYLFQTFNTPTQVYICQKVDYNIAQETVYQLSIVERKIASCINKKLIHVSVVNDRVGSVLNFLVECYRYFSALIRLIY